MKIDIIGAGVGGLTTAIALKQKGFKTRVFEQAPEIKPFGAGIIIANNAMQVYEKLGLKEKIESLGNPISSMNVTKPDLKPISKISLVYFEKKYGVKNIAIHRGKLQQMLIEELQDGEINLNKRLIHLTKNGEFSLKFDDGSQITSEIIIGADGINSVVRNSLFSTNEIRNAKQICWRGITDFQMPVQYQNELNEAWGNGGRFGFVQIAPNKVYWYALKTHKNGAEESSTSTNSATELKIMNFFEQYHPLVRELINSTPVEAIHTDEISDLKPIPVWVQENVCLVGDAAHATTPNMGQGACQAIEDADVLVECLSKYPVNEAFNKFQQLRMPKAHMVVNRSWTIGKLAHIQNPIVSKLRNLLMIMTPSSLNKKQSSKVFQLVTV